MNEKALITQRQITPDVWSMLGAIAETSATAMAERQKIAKHLLFCYENELPLSLAVNGGLYTVKNRVEVEGTVIRAQIRKHPDYNYEIRELNDEVCAIAITRDGEKIGEASFTKEDAMAADLWNKDVWQKYPQDMLLNRATSRAYKRFCPDIFFMSVYVRGEIQGSESDVIEGEVVNSTPSMDDLITDYGHELVLKAMQENGGDILAASEWLKNNNPNHENFDGHPDNYGDN